ncbi:DUF3019 domain-containing protein [Aliikangiella coralliicola]|nr:DUF3019 domain-containing protein [Aliikangiella coralliicola]
MACLTKSAKFRNLIDNFLMQIVAATFVVCSFNLQAESNHANAELEIKPGQCVALHQGQECYVDVEFSWKVGQQGDYCLYSSQQKPALKCWRKKQNGWFKREIVANENVMFFLKAADSQVILATSELEMAWVYKKNSRSHSTWRMF